MIISSKLRDINKSLVSHFLTLGFWYYRSFISSWTSFILVWHLFNCSLLDQILFTKPFFLCQYWKLQIICIPTTLWSSSRIHPNWSSTLHLIPTPLSTVKSNSAANHHLYADDTQLLLLFSALEFSHPTSCLLILPKLRESSTRFSL